MAEESLLADAESTPSEETETVDAPVWSYAEGINGEGDAPEWYKGDKFKSVADQAKAYKGLEAKLGGFTGAPEAYEITLPDGIDSEFIADDPMMEQFQTWAKEKQLDQGAFTELFHMYVNNENGKVGVDRESELSALGSNAKERLTNIADFAKANLSEEEYNGILEATTTAAGVKAIEALIAKTRGLKIPTDNGEVDHGMAHSDIKERMNDPRYAKDKTFRDETTKMYERLFGKEPARKIIG